MVTCPTETYSNVKRWEWVLTIEKVEAMKLSIVGVGHKRLGAVDGVLRYLD